MGGLMKLRLASNLQLDDLELLILLLLPLECQDYWLGRHHHSCSTGFMDPRDLPMQRTELHPKFLGTLRELKCLFPGAGV